MTACEKYGCQQRIEVWGPLVQRLGSRQLWCLMGRLGIKLYEDKELLTSELSALQGPKMMTGSTFKRLP